MTRWRILLGSAALWLGACGEPLGDAALTTDSSEYVPGSQLTLRLHNGSTEALGYNLCFVSLQRHTEAGWESVPATEQELCQAIQHQLAPGHAESAQRLLAGTLPAGEYRFLTTVEWDGEREAVASPPFLVVAR